MDESWYRLTVEQKVESLKADMEVVKVYVTNHIPTQLNTHFLLILGLYALIITATLAQIFTRH